MVISIETKKDSQGNYTKDSNSSNLYVTQWDSNRVKKYPMVLLTNTKH